MLVVDDEPSIRLLCRINLELEGFRLLEAANLTDARRLVAEEHPEVVLVDVHVRDEDGRELVRELVHADGWRPRVALLTGSVSLTAEERAGADAVIEKPFRLEQLIETVERLASQLDSPLR